MLEDIRKAPLEYRLTLYSNGGKQTSNLIGTLPGFGIVWYIPAAIANILSFAGVRDDFPIHYDYDSDVFSIETCDATKIFFERDDSGLYV